jgi:sucrose-6-phosphate hydrolase SacC (GH32 family)
VTWRLLEGRDEYTLVGFDAAAKQLFVDRTKSGKTDFSERYPSRTVAPLDPGTGPLTLRIFLDRSSIEVFGDDGRVVMTNLVFPKPESTAISVVVEGGEADDFRVHIWNLRSIWKAPKD